MPYVTKERARLLRAGATPERKGDLTFLAADMAARFMGAREILHPGKLTYAERSDAVAALNDAAREVQRRFVDDYEQEKLEDPLNADPFADLLRSL
jgi:hypothetical protein